jgi:hypothetical protein
VFFNFSLLHFVLVSADFIHTKYVRVFTVEKFLVAIFGEDSINSIDVPLPNGNFVILEATLSLWVWPILSVILFRELVNSWYRCRLPWFWLILLVNFICLQLA